MRPLRRWPALAVALAWLLWLPPATAHTFGGGAETRFELPIWVVWAAGALVVAVSFAIVGGFLSQGERGRSRYTGKRRAVVAVAHEESLAGELRFTPGAVVGLATLVAIAAVAVFPTSDSLLPETALWLVAWGLLPLLAYTVADVWPRLSPFHALAPMADALRGGRAPKPYPRWLGAWPATFFLVLLTGLEVSEATPLSTPQRLALAIVGYTVLTLSGMATFGAAVWLREAEVVTRALRWWRAASPVGWQDGHPRWRGFSRPLERLPVQRTSDVAFTLALLYGVNFDAFLATGFGRTALAHYQEFVPAGYWALLLTGYLLFVAAWLGAVAAVRQSAESLGNLGDVSTRLAASVLPIAVAYHLAHNLFYLAENLPRFAVALLDPVGLAGWPDAFVQLPTHLAWPTAWGPALGALQMLVIVVGHIVAVVVAHHLAFRTFPSRIQAIAGEVPLTVVMVFYTGIGLWFLGGATA